MIGQITYNGDGSTRIFPVSFEILGEDYVQVFINNIAISDRTKYDIINNSIVFLEGYAPEIGTDNVVILVASSPTEIGDLNTPPSSIQSVLDNIDDINTAAANIIDIQNASSNAITATNQATIATNKASEASESATSASNSATTATTKASEASAAATSASNSATSASNSATTAMTKAQEAVVSASNAEASALTAGAYANIEWGGFSVVDGELIVTYVNGLTSTPSLVDGDFIITY